MQWKEKLKKETEELIIFIQLLCFLFLIWFFCKVQYRTKIIYCKNIFSHCLIIEKKTNDVQIFVLRSGQSEPVGWRVHKRPPPAQPHQAQNCGNGCSRGSTLRHFEAAQGFPRLRLQNPQQISGKVAPRKSNCLFLPTKPKLSHLWARRNFNSDTQNEGWIYFSVP